MYSRGVGAQSKSQGGRGQRTEDRGFLPVCTISVFPVSEGSINRAKTVRFFQPGKSTSISAVMGSLGRLVWVTPLRGQGLLFGRDYI